MYLNFSGHETFPFRQLWAYKASELLRTSKNPFTKDRDQSMMNMGLGANMLKSMSFWIQSSGLIKSNNQGEYSSSMGCNLWHAYMMELHMEVEKVTFTTS